MKRMGRHGATENDLNTLLLSEVMAQKNAVPSRGEFPLVIFVQGGGRPAHSAFILCEFLASHGFYVATMPNIGLHTQKNDGGALQNDLQLGDIEFIKGYLSSNSKVNGNKLSLISFSKGTEASFLYQMKNRDTDAIITLDGIPDTVLMGKSPYYFPNEMNCPTLLIQSNHANKYSVIDAEETHLFRSYFQTADRTVLRFMELNHPGLLSIGMIESVLVPNITRFPPIGDTQLSHELLCEEILNFLTIHLKNEEVVIGRKSPGDLVVQHYFPANLPAMSESDGRND